MKQLLFMVLAAAVACARTAASPDEPKNEAPVGSVGDAASRQADWTAIEKLESQAKAIAKTSGCNSAAACRAAPVGSRACGGPRYYISYCSATTDSAALYRKLGEVAKAEQAYNTKYQVVSTCEYRMPPLPEFAGGSCKVP